jgi:vancomycin permeability regulator SanA
LNITKNPHCSAFGRFPFSLIRDQMNRTIASVLTPEGRSRIGLILSLLALSLCFHAHLARAGDDSALEINAEVQERVTELIQDVLGPYHVDPTLTNGQKQSASAVLTNIEANFRAASRLMPDRLDLRLGIGSALIGLAVQTNSEFAVKMKSALDVYRETHALGTNGFQAGILFSAYSRAIGETNESATMISRLLAVHPLRTRAYLERFRRVDEILKIVPEGILRPVPDSTNRNYGIVILGAGLETNGVMKPKLLDRLRQGLSLARENAECPIIVTGGNAHGGITEAFAMNQWLINEGISTNRIHLEDQARDTVGNAFYSCTIFQKLGLTRVTLVTSASHIRRALVDFNEASRERGLKMEFYHLAARDVPEADEWRERVATYRDAMRASGIWAYPGIQR